MDKADVATKIDHIDEVIPPGWKMRDSQWFVQLLNRVELETASRQQEADKLVDESREVRKRYPCLLQGCTSIDPSIRPQIPVI